MISSKVKTRSKNGYGARTTKKAMLIKLLNSKSGLDAAVLSKMLGWQPHTTRAAISRLRKAGHFVTTSRSSKGRPAKYRITGTNPASASQTSCDQSHEA